MGMRNSLLSPHQVFELGSWDAFTAKVVLEISYHTPLPTLPHPPWDRIKLVQAYIKIEHFTAPGISTLFQIRSKTS